MAIQKSEFNKVNLIKNNNIFRSSSRLARRLVIYVVLASTLITVFTSAFQLYEIYKVDVSGIESRLNEIRDSYVDNIASRLWVADQEELEQTLQGILRLPDIEHIRVYEDAELIIDKGTLPNTNTIKREYPLTYTFQNQPQLIGLIQITASLESVYQHLIDQATTIIISNAIKTFLISGFMLFLFFQLVARHLRKMAEYAETISIKNLDRRLVLDRRENDSSHQDEFDLLVDAFHTMQFNLDESITQLSKNELNLSQTLNSIGDGVIATDIKGQVTRMNRVAEKLTGWKLADARGKPLSEIFSIVNAQTREPAENPVERVIATGEMVGLASHTVLIARGGTEYQIADSAAPIYAEQQHIIGAILVFRDVTEEYALQETIRSNEQRLQAIINNSPAVIYVKDVEGRYMMINRQFETLFNISSEEICGKTTHDVFPRTIADEMASNDQDVLHSRLALHSEERAPQEDGMHIYSSSKFCLFDQEGEPYAVCGISTDITESRKQAELLRRSQKMDAIGKLTGGVAHDFNNILNVIIGYAEILRRNLDKDSPNLHFTEEIKAAGERGAALTRKLLSFSGQSGTEESKVNINRVLQDDANMLKKTLTARVHVTMKLDDELWPVMVDKGELEDAILNMSINAMHAMPGGGKLSYVTQNESLAALEADAVGLPCPGDYVRLSIIDSGIGVDEKTQSKIFDPFFTTKGKQGTGLGLSQVYGFMERCGGIITVHSDVGRGTEFSLYFPRDHSGAIADEGPSGEGDDPEEFRGTEIVLLVDDEKALLELGQNILRQQGYKVYCAEGADSALWILSRNRVDVMVSDVIMPGMDGYELARQVKQMYPQVKIQLASGYTSDLNNREKDNPYSKTLLDKPYSVKTLLRRVRNLLDSE
ncbi:PAS domain-containing protein [Sulfuriflexus mobilis]|uniref:PAS domain-containing protein n=1 Tax=Sulfuriflexus mobilis TaxID=1811807 RepID=UPI000F827EAB|nr:PAS domain-containing protein [Sulfuriflexus mobilis]